MTSYDDRATKPVDAPRSPREILEEARGVSAAAKRMLATADTCERDARSAYEAARDDVVHSQLAAMPLGRLRQTTKGGLRLTALQESGYRTIADIIDVSPGRLQAVHGVGPQTAWQVIGAARQIESAMKENLQLRFNPDERPASQTALLGALRLYESAQRVTAPVRERELFAQQLEDLSRRAGRASSRFKMFFTRGRRRADVLAAVEQLADHLGSASFDALALELAAAEPALEKLSNPSAAELWDEYLSQVAYFNGALIEVGGLAPDIEAVQGFIPAEIAERVNAFSLDTSLLSVNLRGYQAFGAKFALTQERAILGDEMGLGKTVEALAAIGHLWSGGETHSFVVCPASVLVNWIHETERHTDLRAYRIHGAERDRNLRQWTSRGGIGVTTFESLRGVPPPRDVDLALLVVDEAHYVKNPYARRTEAVRRWIAGSERTLFLTGTPMENRVEEFRTLVGHLRPAIASRLSAVDGLAGAATFRKTVAPVYLRRNQADVLEELPPRIETEEWVEFDSDDFDAYRAAVLSGNFMAMRQAAFVPGTIHGSAKLGRLVEIAHEAAANGRKVVVFSFFLQVLKAVTTALGDLAVGPLTGAVPPIHRQRLVDEFSSRREPAVLISQIQAGGVGLNMQAASVVILTEPQWKPTTEDQAVARCHRMGQARPVDVHRLLADDSVDRRMLEILARKELLFDEYVRRSELKDISPDAVDISHLKETSIVATQAEAERRIIEVERRRMGLD